MSQATRVLVDQIVERGRGPRRALAAERTQETLEALGQRGSPSAIPHLLPWLVPESRRGLIGRVIGRARPSASSSVAPVAARAIASLLARTPVSELAGLDDAIRHTWPHGSPTAWDRLRSLDSLPFDAEEPHAMHALASLHSDGHLREAALRELAQARDGRELPFLLLRLNDWVEPIRRFAEQEVLLRAQPPYARHFAAALPLVARLDDLTRADHVRVVAAVQALLLSPDAIPALLEAATRSDRVVRRHCLRLLVENQDTPWGELLPRTARDADLSIRCWTARKAVRQLPREEAAAQLVPLARDPHLGVRIEALRGLLQTAPEQSIAHLRSAMFDRSGSVREFARFHLDRMGAQLGTPQVYRLALETAEPARLEGALGGLGETGTQADIPRVRTFLGSRRSREVQTALRALARLDPDGSRAVLLTHLDHPRAAVRGLAARLLEASIADEDFEALRRSIRSSSPVGSKQQALRLARRLSTWPSLRLLLALPAAPQGPLAHGLFRALSNWCREHSSGRYVPPSPTLDELEDARRLWTAAQPWLPLEIAEEIAVALQTAGVEHPRAQS